MPFRLGGVIDLGSGLIEAALDRPVEPRFLRSLW